ncbi:MAG: Gfo/Idh/MocA family oxidoreductase, partial [Candidatus Solibacter usitatus]|nr:Gfo/Idh/MocA family oxidoreductase [Candidatus Solibacter usitatus]
MPKPIRLAIAGAGRIGVMHALHAQEIANETDNCVVTALVEPHEGRARATAEKMRARQKTELSVFSSVEEMAASGLCDATIIATPTDAHQSSASILVKAGQRVLLEKPLTGTLEEDRAFAAELDAK